MISDFELGHGHDSVRFPNRCGAVDGEGLAAAFFVYDGDAGGRDGCNVAAEARQLMAWYEVYG
jgi:hypothetical protein